jgi:hypothetical protein
MANECRFPDFIREKETQIGALLTMRDAESVRRIEDEIEMSRRLSASSRITRGVAHEVKTQSMRSFFICNFFRANCER